jgi:hypothetical protein
MNELFVFSKQPSNTGLKSAPNGLLQNPPKIVETMTAPRILQTQSNQSKNMTTQIMSGGGNAD